MVFLGRRLRQLANEREKLLRAYYADAIDVATLKREQARINARGGGRRVTARADGEKLRQATKVIDSPWTSRRTALRAQKGDA